MGSKENINQPGLKVDENKENTEVHTRAIEFKEEDNNVSTIDGKKTTNAPPRRESSIKSKSVLKQGHLRVKQDGQKVYKKTPSQAIMAATQLGIGFSVGRLGGTPERDILMVDFYFVEKVWFPSAGTKETPSHKYNEFRFKSYAPVAFRYFRDLFGIQPSDFLLSLASEPIKEISNPGASGSLFFVSNDDMFIVKTVQHKEATFLQQLLPGYYMNIHQNPRTLLPKFFGLYCYQSGTSNIRLTVMNNLLPSKYKCHKKFDLKGSTFKRKASKSERSKKSPIWKDLDFLNMFPTGILLDAETYDTVIKTIMRDVRVLESFNIMDYSFLLGIHNLDESEREKEADRVNSPSKEGIVKSNPDREARRNEFGAAMEAIHLADGDDEFRPRGGVPAKNDKGERLILFMGIIDILQSYRLVKKMEHGWKSLLTDGNTVSVIKPSVYSTRFLEFIKDHVFCKCAVQRGNTKRRSVRGPQLPGEKGETDKIVCEYSAISSEDAVTTDTYAPKSTKVVTIVEPEPSINGSIDYLSTGMESNGSSVDLLDSETTNDEEVSDNNFPITSEIASAISDTHDSNELSHNLNLLPTKEELDSQDSQNIIEQSEANYTHKNTTVNDSNIGNVKNEVFDGDELCVTDDVIDINDIELITHTESTSSSLGRQKDSYSLSVEPSSPGNVESEKYTDESGGIGHKENGDIVQPSSPLMEDSHL